MITTFGALPEDIAFDTLTLSFLFDTDADAFTGASVEGFPGIDREVILRVASTGLPGGITVGAALGEVGANDFVPLTDATTVNLNIEADLDIPGEPRGAQYTIQIPKEELNLAAMKVPVGVLIRTTPLSPAGVLVDTAALTFDRESPLTDPTLTLFDEFARPGDSIDVDLDGFSPSVGFELDVGGVTVLDDVLDGNGSFSGFFVLPDVPAGPRAVAGVDADGAYAFNVLFVSDLSPVSLMLDRAAGGGIDFEWTTLCAGNAEGYGIYEGTLGSWYSHRSLTCTDTAQSSASIVPGAGDRYYLVVGLGETGEGSYGTDSTGLQRVAGGDACRTQQAFGTCP